MKTAGVILLLVILLGCQTRKKMPPQVLSQKQAQALACRLANEQSRALYKCEPFENEAEARFEGTRWEWTQYRGLGDLDMEARVSFASDGSAQRVKVLLLDNRVLR